jgi:molecular chaperone GrpE
VSDGAFFSPEGAEPGSELDGVEPMEDATLEDELAALGDPLAVAERERDEYLAALQRLQADFENYRKRVARTGDELAGRIAADLVAKLLPVLDALDLAQSHFGSAEEAELDSLEAKALVQARALLLDTLAREGLARIDEVAVAFDPQVHDAVAHTPGPPGEYDQVVDDVLRAGYTWKGTVLRPAMVRVRG